MRQIPLIFIISIISHHACANEPDDLFGALTGLYWCMNKEVPTDLKQINKGLGFQLPPNANQANYEKWLDTVKLLIENDELIVIRASDSEMISSKVNCESVNIEQ